MWGRVKNFQVSMLLKLFKVHVHHRSRYFSVKLLLWHGILRIEGCRVGHRVS
jgi:hypothetical protein